MARQLLTTRRGENLCNLTNIFIIDDPEIKINGKVISFADVDAIDGDFEEQQVAARALGIEIDVRRAAVATSKHIRARPQFPVGWTCEFDMAVESPVIFSKTRLADLFGKAGLIIGLCDYRPSSKMPGIYGRFTAKLEQTA